MRKWANGISAGCAAIIGSNVWATVLFVDDTASGANTGDSWDNAYVSLQSALNWPLLSPGDQIWVAAGTYKPGTDVSNAFLMKADVKIWGGFAGGETDPSARNPSANTCILSGFISSGRSHHVFIASGTAIDRDAELDGFTITGGDAAETDNPNGGGMLVLNGSSPTIRRCKFTDNFAECGGGASVQSDPAGPSSNPEFRECVFLANTGGAYGGGVFVSRSAPILVQCQFIDNTAGSYNPFTQVVTGGNGGGVQIKDVGSAVIFNCMFQNNKCGHVGGGLSMRENVNSVQTLVANCTFVANHCHDSGGGVRVGFGSNARFVNCTFAENYCKETDNEFFHGDGGGLSIGSDQETETGRNVVLDNCIFWNNRLESSTGRGTQIALIGAYSGTAMIQYSDIQDSDASEAGVWVQSGWTAPTPTAWFDVDPDFVEDPDAGSDGWGNSNDDFGDLRLASTSPIINRGDCSLVPNDEGDVNNANGTSEVLPLDLGLVHRRIDRVEMGAFEYQTPQHEYCAFDINDDNAIGVADLLAVIVSWGPCPGIPTACLADIAPQPCTDGAVGVADLLAVIAHWANVCGGTPSNDAPQTVQDCMDICGGQFGFGSPEYCNCMEKCCSTLP